ncbi:MAG: sulfite exporter TauE/SafE family protein [Oscillospiraceae bacterium]|nr:sulfite exporter TauE/SafE family protein [Oscillospiraceae bacterium]
MYNYIINTTKKYFKSICGFLCGLLNGLFGSGGGVVAVPMLRFMGLEPRKSHATSVAVIFFLSLLSVIAYGIRGSLDVKTALVYVPWGIIGAVCGALLLKKVPNTLLRRIFGAVVLISAVRILLL